MNDVSQENEALPASIPALILQRGLRHQAAIGALTITVFLLELLPLELQRRIVNGVVEGRAFRDILLLGGLYAAVGLVHGAVKLTLNLYRAWMGESATRRLREVLNERMQAPPDGEAALVGGIEVSMIVAEVEPVGAFVGESISEPLLQAGVLASILVYLVSLEPRLAAAMLAIFALQIIFVPLMQRGINRRTAARIQSLRNIGSGVMWPPGTVGRTANGAAIIEVFSLNMRIFQLKFGMNYLMNLTHNLEIVCVLVFGGWLTLQGAIEIGTVVAFISGISRLNDPWGDLVNYFRDLSSIAVKYDLLRRATLAFAGRA